MIVNQNIDGVFFDLDGTLLDTAHDLVTACNQLLAQQQQPPIAFDLFRPSIAGGTINMICNSLKIKADHPDMDDLVDQFTQFYRHHLTQKTHFFPGMDEVLDALDQNNITWGIVTNKKAWLAEPLLDHFGLTQRSRCIVSGDTVAHAKPHPAPLLHACKLAHTNPQRSVYVGDMPIDVKAAHAAGMIAVAVSYGYRAEDNDPQQWQADRLIDKPLELLQYLQE